MKVEVAGANRYTITFAPGAADTVVANGRADGGEAFRKVVGD